MKKIFALILMLMLNTMFVFADDGIIAEFDMTEEGGYSKYYYANVQHIEDGTGNKYLSATAGYVTFPYTAVTGSYNIELDIKIPNGNQSVSVLLKNSDGSVSEYVKEWNWSGDAPNCDWVTMKFEVNTGAGSVNVYKNGVLLNTLEGIVGLEEVCNIQITRWSETVFLDNVKVYRPICEVSSYCFGDYEGNKSENIDDFNTYPPFLHITFSTPMNESSVAPILLKNGNEIPFNTDWDSDCKVLTIYPTDDKGVFEYGAEYKLTIPGGFSDLGGGVCTDDYIIEFERTAVAGVIANFDMEENKNGITGSYNTRDYKEDVTGRRYLEVYDDNVAFKFGDEITSGTLTLEFDFANIVIDDYIHTSVWFTDNGTASGNKADVMSIKGNASSADGEKWIKYKLIVDFENDKIIIYKNDELSETITGKGIDSIEKINGIGFTRWGGKVAPRYFGIDNLRAYITESGITGYKFCDFGGLVSDKVDSLYEAVESIVVEFKNEPVAATLDIELLNNKTMQTESVELDIVGRYVTIKPVKGYFDASSDYELSILKTYTNKYGYVGENGLTISFNSGNKVFGLKSMKILENGSEIQFSDISAGDNLEIEIVYVLTDVMQPVDTIVALSCEKNSAITSFDVSNVSLNQPGLTTVTCPFAVKSGAEIDTVYAYIWDAKTRVPKMNCVILAE